MQEIIYGRNPVTEMLRASAKDVERVVLLAGVRDGRLLEISSLAQKQGIALEARKKFELDRLVGHGKHQGVAAVIRLPGYVDVGQLLRTAAARNEPALLAILDGIEDPHNLGAILRSADGAGLHGVVIPKKRAVGLTATVAKTSAGAMAHMKMAQVTNLSRAMDMLKEEGVWFVGADQEARQDYTEADLGGPLGIVVGAEGKGLRRLVKEKCDFLVRIPMFGKINSLNASVAAALLFFEARRQRRTYPEKTKNRKGADEYQQKRDQPNPE